MSEAAIKNRFMIATSLSIYWLGGANSVVKGIHQENWVSVVCPS